ncbi:hypothetical protein F4820DRAFT_169818 [Hypoxylon rubiginosum]|uniref:Uncharacterized protein n=1 Tax=Hypoxylon rubiginosum TaxID=110542 RepID=A0ACB9ZAB6_9PEZI|nr:hypothetical protein F4820DRAFT_169818 [Hypoxylon rubiginosum]
MEPKQLEERQTLEDQNKYKTTTQTGSLPTGSQETRGDTDTLTIDRPWANRLLTLDSCLQKEDWWKTKDHNTDSVERWSVQSMTNEPYHTVKSVIGQDGQTKFSGSQSSPPSETAATSGSG